MGVRLDWVGHRVRKPGGPVSVLMRGPLPVSAEVHARPRPQRQPNHAAHLGAVAVLAMALPEGALLGVAGQIDARDVVMVPDLTPAQAAEEALRAIGAGDAVAVGKLMIDPLHDVAGVQVVPAIRLIGVDFGLVRDVVADVGECRTNSESQQTDGARQWPTSPNAPSMRAIATTQLPNARTATVRIAAMRGSSQARTEIPVAITR